MKAKRGRGRPVIGRPVEVRLSPELRAAIDAARGSKPIAAFVREVLEKRFK
jgi:predicted DNA-binding protein